METPSDFIRDKVRADLAAKKYGDRIATRFPPEPNGYLHIGHAKSICLNFGIAREFGGVCHLRMDDTNPTTEDPEYVAAIQHDVKWLGFDWGKNMFFASDYYDALYELAEKLITLGRAYVCDLTEEQTSEYRGTISEPGKNSPFRDRTVEENLDLFRRMRKGEFKEGQCVLRAKIDMSSPNMKMRDPPIYRIKHAHHYRTGDKWCIYPLYDYAHCLSDSIEKITHSICTMEFESARELYDWVIEATEVPWVPKQTEFARLNLTYTVMSKRKLLELVQDKHVNGWDDPRLPTIAGLRRRGIRAEAIREFCARIGIAKNLSTVDVALLEHCVREDLNDIAPRVLAVLDPIKVTITNWDRDVDVLDGSYWPRDIPKTGERKIPFGRELFIDRDDFMENPPKDFHRLAPGRSVRLRHGYVITCDSVVKEGDRVVELRCSYDPASRGGASSNKKIGTIHWVSAGHALDVEVRVYDRLFNVEQPGNERDFKEDINPQSLSVIRAKVEPSLASANIGDRFQFERLGFFIVDKDSKPNAPVFNRIIALKDSYSKQPEKPPAAAPRAPVKLQSNEKPALSPEAGKIKAAYSVTDDEARAIANEPLLQSLLESAGRPEVVPFLVNEVVREIRSKQLTALPFDGSAIVDLLMLVNDGTLSNKLAKDVLSAMIGGEGSPREIVSKRGLAQTSDASAITAAIDRVLAQNPDTVAKYRAGNQNVVGALIGLCIKETGGKANPKLVGDLVRKKLA